MSLISLRSVLALAAGQRATPPVTLSRAAVEEALNLRGFEYRLDPDMTNALLSVCSGALVREGHGETRSWYADPTAKKTYQSRFQALAGAKEPFTMQTSAMIAFREQQCADGLYDLNIFMRNKVVDTDSMPVMLAFRGQHDGRNDTLTVQRIALPQRPRFAGKDELKSIELTQHYADICLNYMSFAREAMAAKALINTDLLKKRAYDSTPQPR